MHGMDLPCKLHFAGKQVQRSLKIAIYVTVLLRFLMYRRIQPIKGNTTNVVKLVMEVLEQNSQLLD